MGTVSYGDKCINIVYDVDTVVLGGGTAGAVAAISAARGGNKTLVIEKTISLGGTQTNSLVCPMMPTYVETFNINKEIINQLEEEGCITNDGQTKSSWFNTEDLSYVLQEKILQEGGQILFDAHFYDVILEEDKINYILVNTCEGTLAIKGKNFIDASGDALLSRACNIPTVSGNEEGKNQMVSFRFEMGGIDVVRLMDYMKSLGDNFCKSDDPRFYEIAMEKNKNFVLEPIFKKGLEDGVLEEEDLRYFQAFTIPNKNGVMSFNCPHIPGVDKNTSVVLRSEAIIKGRRMIRRLIAFLNNYIPGFEGAFLLREASQLGVRESYRIVGKYVLSEEDYLNRSRFEDGIARGDWYIDVHTHNNKSLAREEYKRGEYYEIPYRSLISNEISNIITVGRCISTTFLMQASVRIQPTLRDLGQIAGEACVMSVKDKVDLNKINGKYLRKL